MQHELFLKRRDTVNAYQVTAEMDVPQDDVGLAIAKADVGDWLVTQVNGVPLANPQVFSNERFTAMYELPRQRAELSGSVDVSAIASGSVDVSAIADDATTKPLDAHATPSIREQLAKELTDLGINPESELGKAAIDKALASANAAPDAPAA